MTSDGPCPHHPAAAQIGGVCGACTIQARVGSFSVEAVLPYPHESGCRSTIHCANFGFCHRCAPDLAEAGSHIIKAMDEIGRVSDGELYDVLMSVLIEARDMNERETG